MASRHKAADLISRKLTEEYSHGKRIPAIGYQVNAQDVSDLDHAYKNGSRHFLFDHTHSSVVKEWYQNNHFHPEDVFLTLKVSLNADRFEGAQAVCLKFLQKLEISCLDLVVLQDTSSGQTSHSQWLSKWLELESLYTSGLSTYVGVISSDASLLNHLLTKCRNIRPQVLLFPALWDDLVRPRTTTLSEIRHLTTRETLQLGVVLNFTGGDESEVVTNKELVKTTIRVLMASKMFYVVSSTLPAVVRTSLDVLDYSIPAVVFRQVKTVLHL